MLDFEALLDRIRARHGEEAVRRVLERVEAEVSRDPKLTRLGALLLVAGEMGYLSREGEDRDSLRLADLVGGLRGMTVTCRVLGIKGPVQVSGRKVSYARVGDGSAKLDLVAWGEAAESLSRAQVGFGDAVRLTNVRVSERAGGLLELHVDERSTVAKVEAPWIPPAGSMFERSLSAGSRGPLDVEATVLGVGAPRSFAGPKGPSSVRSALLLVGGFPALLSARDEHLAGEQLEPWTAYRFASLRLKEGRLVTTSRTCASRSGPVSPEEALGAVRVLGPSGRGYAPATNGRFWLRLGGEVPPQGEAVVIRSARFEERGRAWFLVVGEREPVGAEVGGPLDVPLDSLAEGMREVSVRGRLVGKSAVSEVRTAAGRVKAMAFWLTDGGRSIVCRAWREACDAVSGIPEGAEVRLRFVRVSRSRWGELEVHVDPESEVEEIREA
ncbi:MAG: hypothetical protein ABDH63_04830 [Candidatus Caldarchaeales archaeon]